MAGLLLAALFLTCCGNGDRGQPTAVNSFYTVTETIQGQEMENAGDYLYYVRYNAMETEEETEEKYQLIRVSLDETGSVKDSLAVFESEQHISKYAVDEDGAIYCLLKKIEFMKVEEQYQFVLTGVTLVKILPDGTEGYCLALDGVFHETGDSDLASMAVNDIGQVFLLSDREIYMIDEEGRIAGGFAVDDYCTISQYGKELLFRNSDGEVYCYVDNNTNSLYKLQGTGASLQFIPVEGMPWPSGRVIGTLYGSPAGLLYKHSEDGILYRYDEEQGAWHGLLHWVDSGLAGGSVQRAVLISEKLIAVQMTGGSINILSDNSAEGTPEKQRLVVAATGIISYDLEKYVAEFNRNSDFLVTIEIYDRTEEGLARLDARLVSSDPPDLLDLSGLDMQKYASKGALENLAPYLEQSNVLSGEDFLENALEGYTVDGELMAIPDRFKVNVLVGRAAQLETGGGWTMKEACAFADSYRDHSVFVFKGFEFVYDICKDYVLEAYVNWETGECSFDSQGFRELAEWLADHSKGIETEYDRAYDTTEGVLLYKLGMSSCWSFVWPETIFGCETVTRAYPSFMETESYKADAYDVLGILSVSPEKENAWKFMEGFYRRIPGEGDFYYGDAFPCRRELLEEHIAYYREGGGYGKQAGSLKDGKNGWRGLNREQEDELRGILSAVDFVPEGGVKAQVTSIVKEELAYYLTGQKPLEEVTGIIQNRVQNLLQETQM